MSISSNKKKKSAEGAKVTKKELIALVLSVVIALFVLNFMSSRHFFRVDMTEDKEFTLSKSTKDILKNLDDVVNLQLYFTKNLPPALAMLKRDVDDILAEYKTYGGRKLNIQFIDPQESPQREQQVVMMGIPPVQLNVVAKDRQELVKVFLGMAVVHEDRKEIIPVMQRTGSLEYELTSAIIKVSTKEIPTLKWITKETGAGYNNIKALLGQRYNVVDVKAEELNLDSVKDALLVLAIEEDLTEAELSQIDQYLTAGGKVLVMIDLVKVGNNLQVIQLEVGNIAAWLKKHNIEVKDNLIKDRSSAHAAFSGGNITYHVPYPYWVKVGPKGFDKDSMIVADLDLLILPWASPLEVGAERAEGTTYKVIAKSSPFNQIVGLDASLSPDGSNSIFKVGETESKPLAVLATIDNAQLMVVGNSRFIQDNFLQQFRANALFFENSVDFMAMGNQLIGIRSKGMTSRPVEEISASGIAFVKYINLLGMPIVLVALGLVIILVRRQRRQVLRSVYK